MVQIFKKQKIKFNNERQPAKWLRIFIPGLLIVLWFIGGSVGGPYFGKIEEVSSTDLTTFLPKSAEATKVSQQLSKFRDEKTIPLLAVFEKKYSLTDQDIEKITEVSKKAQEVEDVVGQVSPPIVSDDKQAAFFLIPLKSDGEFKEILPEVKKEIQDANLNLTYKLTGPASFANDLSKAFAGIDGILLLVALAVVFIILLLVYRSPILPFLVLFTSMFALAVSILVVWNLAKADIIDLNGQVQGILFILVIGAATDYSLLYVARYREELEKHRSSWVATQKSLRASLEPILASGGTVIAGLLCLLLSDLSSNKALGPVGATGIVFAMLSALTFLPALLSMFGRVAFWPVKPRYSSSQKTVSKHTIWNKVANFVSVNPRKVWIGTTIVLLLGTITAFQIKAEGVEQSDLILGYSEAREGQAILNRHLPPGSGAPLQIITSEKSINSVLEMLDKDRAIASVSVVTENSPSNEKPLGKQAQKIEQEIRQSIDQDIIKKQSDIRAQISQSFSADTPSFIVDAAVEQATANLPSVDTIFAQANPFKDASPKIVNDKVLLSAVLNYESDSKQAKDAVLRLRDDLKKVDNSTLIGGVTATQVDTNKASIHDRQVIIPAILAAITVILIFLLRSLLAPVLLLLTTVLSFGTTLGVSAILFNDILKFPGADPSVVLYGFVFLVALGIDYNIFLMTRVREESIRLGTRKGVIRGLIVTGGVITSAGIVLAATFAALAVIPILFLAQLAFVVAFGVLLDTIIVRSLLVPALMLDIGKHAWWPFYLKKDT
jgi:RND superfamily putative drug exporter